MLRAGGEVGLLRPEARGQEGLLLSMSKGDSGTNSPTSVGRVWSELAAPLRAFVARRVPAEVDVEDVLQDVFLKIHDRLPQLDDRTRVDAWVFQVTRNALVDLVRRKQRGRAGLGRPVDSVALDELAASEESDERPREADFIRCLAPMVARLDEPYREAIEMTDLGGLTQAEAAARLGISVSGMKSRVQRGRDRLREMLLRCCAMEFDRRGALVDYDARRPVTPLCCAVTRDANPKKESS